MQKGQKVARISGSKAMILSIEIEFVNSRLSEAYIATAYELALPPVSRNLDQREKRKSRSSEKVQQLTLETANG